MFAACARAGMWLVILLRKMILLPQPLDVYSFASLAARVKARFQKTRANAAVRELDAALLLDAACDAVASCLTTRAWGFAFDKCGFGVSQASISQRWPRSLELAAVPMISNDRQPRATLFPRWRSVARPCVGCVLSSARCCESKDYRGTLHWCDDESYDGTWHSCAASCTAVHDACCGKVSCLFELGWGCAPCNACAQEAILRRTFLTKRKHKYRNTIGSTQRQLFVTALGCFS